MGVWCRGVSTAAETRAIQWSAPRVFVEAAIEPISLADAKRNLKVDDDVEDVLIAQRIMAARQKVEHDTGRFVVRTTYDLTCDTLAAVMVIPYAPIAEVVSLTLYDSDDLAIVLDPNDYVVDVASDPPRLLLWDDAASWPSTTIRDYSAGVLRFVGGPAVTAASPAWAIEAMYQLLAHWHDQRAAVIVGLTAEVMPYGYQDLIESHRIVGVA